MKTVLSGTHQPEQPQPKRTRRSPKKRRNEKSEVATPEFGTNSLDKPSHGEPTSSTSSTSSTRSDDVPEPRTRPAASRYQRELQRAKRRYAHDVHVRVREAEISAMAIGIVIGMVIGFGAWWLSSLF